MNIENELKIVKFLLSFYSCYFIYYKWIDIYFGCIFMFKATNLRVPGKNQTHYKYVMVCF